MKMIKRNTTTEEFDIEKIRRVVVAAGLTTEQADEVVKEVLRWIEEQGKNEIETTDLRKKVQEELKNHNEYAANLYEWYEDTKYKK